MQFGVQFFPAVDHTDKGAADYYAQSLAIAEEAERLGFTHARTVEHYILSAVRLACDLPRLSALRGALRQRMKASALMDGASLTAVVTSRP